MQDISENVKINKLKKLESVIQQVQKTGKFGNKQHCLEYLKKTLSLS